MGRIEIAHILCPVDLSEQSRHAYGHALSLARWCRADVTLMEVLWDAVPPVPFDPPSADWRGQIDEARAELDRFAGTHDAVKVVQKVFEGPVVKRILAEARALPADLIVIGTHGVTGFERLVLGSVAEKVLRKALCPVLTVPPAVADPSTPFSPFSSVLCAVDFSPASMRGLAYAGSLAKESGGRLGIMFVADWPTDEPAFGEISLEIASHRRRLQEEATRRLECLMSGELRRWCEPRVIVTEGKAHERILAVAEEQQADTIVMGVHSRGALNQFFLGSTTNQVVRAAKCPVLTVRM